jgi:hypothetical protein
VSRTTPTICLTEAKLGSYVSKSAGVFKCPSDKTVAENGPRNRSMSMNSLVGDPGVLTNRYNPEFVQFFRPSDFSSPTQIFVFLDEHPDTINDGFFMNRLGENAQEICPRPTITITSFSFVDGHRTAPLLPTRSVQQRRYGDHTR